MIDISMLHFDEHGLIPVVAQEAGTGMVVLVAYMNAAAIQETMKTSEAYFWSRSRQALWHKGETSGHVLKVTQLAYNCEGNSLLLTVTLTGEGACHDGYRTCFYRELTPNGTTRIIAERTFIPEEVYNTMSQKSHDTTSDVAFIHNFAELYAGYERLRDEDFTATSETSRLLHNPTTIPVSLLARASEELQELAGVLDGTHSHSTQHDDIILEASQSLYWIVLASVVAHTQHHREQLAQIILTAWHGSGVPPVDDSFLEPAHRLGSLLAQTNIHPNEPIEHDLAELRQRLG